MGAAGIEWRHVSENDLVGLAERIATEAHAGQFRRDGVTPYLMHPAAVVSRVEGDPEAQVVAWLHDVLEDTTQTPETLLKAGLPPQLVETVELLTKDGSIAYEDYLEQVASSPLATKVKIADMLSNLADGPTTRQIRKYATGLLRLTEKS